MATRPNRPLSSELHDIADFVEAVADDRDERLRALLASQHEDLKALFSSAFPDGDPILHRQYHAEQIELIQARKKLTQALTEKVVTGGVWAALLAVGIAAWNYFKANITGGQP